MRIIDVTWTRTVNMTVILCSCGNVFEHRMDRWVVHCPECHAYAGIDYLRQQYTYTKEVH
jgi:hypothetical protein